MPPHATYRLQLRAGFDFDEVAEIVGYLADLGISHVYLSPIFKAVDGSTHGYDVVDPRAIDPSLGGDQGYTRMISALREHRLGQLIDIVPNHMATAPSNPWWWGVLASGPSSRYARFFDIDWEGRHEASWSKVLAPILGDHYGRVLENGEFELAREGVRFEVRYYEHRLPLSPESVGLVLSAAAHRSASPKLAELADQLRQLHTSRIDSAAALERHRTVARLEDELLGALGDASIGAAVDGELKTISGDVDRLHELLDQQNYRLAYWRTANEEIDYRRFFSIESLVGVRADEPDVFDETHGLIFDLVRDGSVDGLRVDHIDGIRDPRVYLDQLAISTEGVYTIVEKILEDDESLPEDWPVAGTTGYDFLNRVNSIFVDPGSEERMTEIYRSATGETDSYADVLRASKKHILDSSLAAELQNLTAILAQLCSHRLRHRDHTRRALRDTLAEVIASFPVYRLYVGPGGEPSQADRTHTRAAIEEALHRDPDLDGELLSLVADLALGGVDGEVEGEFTRRFQQLTAPVMAKGAEDTAFYRYNRMLSLNEVGGDPGRFGIDVDTFHQRISAMAVRWPETMLTIGTHDTKRSADVRARLNVLAEIPGEWESAVTRWMSMNEPHRIDGVLDANTEYHFYQSLVGAWPIGANRLRPYMEKATREAKSHTSWMTPDVGYESAVDEFVSGVLGDRDFATSVEGFLRDTQLVERGRRNSLRQVTLLLTCPGIPDIYQGSELWDLSLVDPDNRRPVDYDLRRQLSSTAAGPDWSIGDDRGDTKHWLTLRLLGARNVDGTYDPLQVTGRRAGDVVAYRSGGMVAVVPVRSDDRWADTLVELPPGRWRNVLSDDHVAGGMRDMAELLDQAPLAVMVGDEH
jgi:(1->4)-alpha-D-glucan 1-alpha-D-glucosylmutase